MDAAFDSAPEETQKPSEPPVVDWTQYQNAQHLAGRPVQDVINHYNQREYQYGQQANELGELRRQAEEYKKLQQQISGQPQEKETKQFSEIEQQMFIRDFNENPQSALMKHLTPQVAEAITERITEKVSENLMPKWQEQMQTVANQQEYAAFWSKYGEELNKDPRLRDTVQHVMTNYLGEQAPYEQAYLLAKMFRDEEHLSPHTCALMRQGVPFKNAREYALAMHNSPQNAENKKDTIRDSVDKLKFGSKRSAKKQATDEPEIMSMDDAFAPD
ncbi:MAG: hypothetical protein ACYS6W_01645 [Planctomycetota bacterium]|jgi:hypothetical protein